MVFAPTRGAASTHAPVAGVGIPHAASFLQHRHFNQLPAIIPYLFSRDYTALIL
jgi:hypothetical protein